MRCSSWPCRRAQSCLFWVAREMRWSPQGVLHGAVGIPVSVTTCTGESWMHASPQCLVCAVLSRQHSLAHCAYQVHTQGLLLRTFAMRVGVTDSTAPQLALHCRRKHRVSRKCCRAPLGLLSSQVVYLVLGTAPPWSPGQQELIVLWNAAQCRVPQERPQRGSGLHLLGSS